MTLRVQVAVALADRQEVIALELPEGSTVADALDRSGARGFFSAGERGGLQAGIWSKQCALDTPLREGDRVELYRALRADPKDMRRERARIKPSTRSRNGP